jgi:hypothetical protein
MLGARPDEAASFKCVRYLNERMPSLGQIGHHLIKRRVSHEDLFLQMGYRDEEPWPGERILIAKDGKRLALCTRQAVIGTVPDDVAALQQ